MNAPLSNLKDWSEKHEIGARECLLLERAVEHYLSSVRSFETALACDKATGPNAMMYVGEVRNLRDKIIACNSIRIIPNEDQ